jgi:hypothetical protein
MCTKEGARGSMTPARPRWLRLYALAGLMLGALLLTQTLTAAGTERTVLQCGLVLGGFAAMVQWTRRNRAALDHLEWCDCASSRVTMRVIPSASGEPAPVRPAGAWRIGHAEPADADLEEVAR